MYKSSCKYCHIPDKGLPYAEIKTLAKEGEASICELVPLPAINLTTGETDTHCEPPYWAIRVLWYEDGYDAMEDFIPIKYCPMCGRKLT